MKICSKDEGCQNVEEYARDKLKEMVAASKIALEFKACISPGAAFKKIKEMLEFLGLEVCMSVGYEYYMVKVSAYLVARPAFMLPRHITSP